ncbi:MAG: transcriptional regulatory protein (FadR family) [Actinomycetia bacterium]|jgi:GntR family transcriptional repressor for pyruvate dehydrogenase complex|nr:transcriptional regulatory protein (FadR family) [Actinomycetes bacterium]
MHGGRAFLRDPVPMATGSNDRRPGLSQPRVAEMVADILRSRIVNGELADGDMLPKQDDLLAEFRVSRPSIREAMRILETEGLVSVRRGNVGGAEVHAPKPRSAAYMLGLVMQSEKVTLTDVASALRILEPACAALAAARPDRETAVLPALRRLNDEAEAQLEDGPAFTRLAREWHGAMVESCGNQTMLLLVGTLETVWSHHESLWADHIAAQGRYPDVKDRRLVLRAHVKITEAIEAGNEEVATRAARRHLDESQTYLLARDPETVVSITGPSQRFGAFR